MNSIIDKLLAVTIKDLPDHELYHIEIGKDYSGKFTVSLEACENVLWLEESDENLSSAFGTGDTLEEAFEDYAKRVSGKRFVIESDDKEYVSDIIEF